MGRTVCLRAFSALLAFTLAGALADVPAQSLEIVSDIRQVETGGNHTCALTTAGSVLCWGSNDQGQLGDGSTQFRATPVPVLGLGTSVVAIDAGEYHTCALTSGGAVRCWGDNQDGQLGDGSRSDRLTPVTATGLVSGIAAVSTGGNHSCALGSDGSVRCWGRNADGQLGVGNTTAALVAAPVAGLPGPISAISAGLAHTCAVSASGVLHCWGRNVEGQIGDGTLFNRSRPVMVTGLSGATRSVSAGGQHTCALSTAGAMQCWGNNDRGQIGDGSFQTRTRPVAVSGLGSGVTAIASGYIHSCALRSGGSALCWGDNFWGQLGDGSTTLRNVPVQVNGLDSALTTIAAGGNITPDGILTGHTCGLTNTGSVRCWGDNEAGQLGDGTAMRRLTPIGVVDLSSGINAIGAGGAHNCALRAGGTVSCWGYNEYGQLGDGSLEQRVAPVAVVGLGGAATAIAIGGYQSCALIIGGTVRCWGDNIYGQLGDGTTTMRTMPVSVSGLGGGVIAIVAGFDHTCALTSAGAVLCWGRNDAGQLGDGTLTPRITPVPVSGLSSGVTALAAGFVHTCARTSSGAVFCWGANFAGQLGDGSGIDRLTPTPVSGLASGVSTVAAGTSHSCASRDNGDVLCWGSNVQGQLGDGGRTTRPTPAAVIGLGSGATSVFAGSNHACAIVANAAAKCWGSNLAGQIGDGSTIDRLVPTAVSGQGSGVRAIRPGFGVHTCALSIAGATTCWGLDSHGQIGDGGRNYAVPAPVLIDRAKTQLTAPTAGANATSRHAVTDATGRFVVFASSASNLIGNADTNSLSDIFRRDNATGTVARVSVDNVGGQIAADSIEPAVSADGQLVVFVTLDAGVNELLGETPADRSKRQKGTTFGVYLRNTVNNTSQRIGAALPGGIGTRPAIAPLGGAVVFASLPRTAAEGVSGQSNLFVVPLQRTGNQVTTGPTTCVSCKQGQANSNGASRNGVLTADGNSLAYETEASNQAQESVPCPAVTSRVVLRNLLTGSIQSVSAPRSPGECAPGGARKPTLNWPGDKVAFESDLPLDGSRDKNGFTDVYLRDLIAQTSQRVSTDPRTGHDPLTGSTEPVISGDGSVITFQSGATNLESSEADDNETSDIYALHLPSSDMRRISRNRRGDQADRPSEMPGVSFDGSSVVFASSATNLLIDPASGASVDTNAVSDIFQTVNPQVPISKSGTWWVPSESGWGLATIDQGNALGIGWFSYGPDGEPTWFVGSAVLGADGRYVGDVYRQTGLPLAQISGQATESSTKLADVALTFAADGSLSFEYRLVGGSTRTKRMQRFIFASEDVVCRDSPFASRANEINLSDIWWGGASTSGWGLFLSHTPAALFATWYTFDTDHDALFLIAITERRSDGSYGGQIFRQKRGTPYDQIDNATASSGSDVIGEATFRVLDGETLDFTYRIGATTQTKRISRYLFGNQPGICTTTRQ